jgi:hypothetical protein
MNELIIKLDTIKQGSQPTVTFIWPLPSSHTPTDFTGAVLSGTMRRNLTGAVTAISDGSLSVVNGPTREISWAFSEEDSGTDGTFAWTIKAVIAGKPIYTLNGLLVIEANPDADTVPALPLVGVTTGEAAWLAAARARVPDGDDVATRDGDGTAGELATIDASGNAVRAGYGADAFDAAGSAAAAQAAAVQRANHTGTQLATTISDFSTASLAQIAAFFAALPTVEPSEPGRAWNDSGTVKISLKSYWYRMLEYAPIAYWPMAEPSGTISMCQVNAAQNGAYGNVTLAQTGIGDGLTSAAFNGTTSSNNVHTTTFRDAFDPLLGSILIWGKVSGAGVWTDGTIRYLFYLAADAQNYIAAFKSSVNNTIQVRYRAGNVTESVDITTSSTDWFCLALTWDKVNDRVKGYFNGVQVGATQTGLGTWAGDLTAISTAIGRYTLNNNVWNGTLAHCAVFDEELALADIADLYDHSQYGGTAPLPFELAPIGYMGGSITYGSSASDPFGTSWRARLGAWWPSSRTNHTFTNHMSAISGQGSWNNLVRLQSEIIDNNCAVLFLDGAVNDSIEDEIGTHEDGLYGCAEALIRRAIAGLPSARFIIWIFTWPEDYSYLNDNQIASRDKWLALAEHYGLQVLRWDEYIESLVGAGYGDDDITAYLYAAGNVHPNDAGHLAAYEYAIANLADISGNAPSPLPARLHATSADFEHPPIARYGTNNDGETGAGWATVSTTGRQSSTAGDTIAWSGTFSSFGLKTNISTGAGALRYKVDGGAWATLNLSLIGGSSYVVTSFPRGEHTITFEVVSGLCRFNEFMAI